MLDQLMSIYNHPPSGFHFRVVFERVPTELGGSLPVLPNDWMFQEVSGLDYTLSSEPYKEGGENRYIHHLPTHYEYSDLELKRGLVALSALSYLNRANYPVAPSNLFIFLHGDSPVVPLFTWYVSGAYPVSWSYSSLDATKNEIVIETIKFKYRYFTTIDTIASQLI